MDIEDYAVEIDSQLLINDFDTVYTGVEEQQEVETDIQFE